MYPCLFSHEEEYSCVTLSKNNDVFSPNFIRSQVDISNHYHPAIYIKIATFSCKLSLLDFLHTKTHTCMLSDLVTLQKE